jgi:hypothetical protein
MSVVALVALTLVVGTSVLSRADACDLQAADRIGGHWYLHVAGGARGE